MDKVLLVNKEKGYTSRDVVNCIANKLKEKKVGHFGTLDPLAEGLLVIGIGKLTKIGKKAANGQRLLELLYSQPKVNSKLVSKELDITPATANGVLKAFVEIGILEEKTGYNRNRFYVFENYIKIFR